MPKAAIVLLSNLETHQDSGRVLNALEVTKELKEHGDEVELIFDGAGAETAAAIANPEHDLHHLYSQVEDVVVGVCKYCARAFDVMEEIEKYGLPLSAEYDQHPSLRDRMLEGYQIITF